MSPVYSSRRTSRRVATSPGCEPLHKMYQRALASSPSRWTQVEGEFLEAMWRFDENVRSGLANQGDIQNGKGDFFTYEPDARDGAYVLRKAPTHLQLDRVLSRVCTALKNLP